MSGKAAKSRRKINPIKESLDCETTEHHPPVDVVFKTLLGSEKSKPLLINFLNAVLALPPGKQIETVVLLNPYSEAEYQNDKINIVDIKAKDQQGRWFQVEMQVTVPAHLSARILYTWADLHASQLEKGDQHGKIQPSISIWVLASNLINRKQSGDFHHIFEVYDKAHDLALNDHCQIHTLELLKWSKNEINIREDIDAWVYLLAKGETLDLDNLPAFLKTDLMRQAVETLQQFSAEEKQRALYKMREEAYRVALSTQEDLEDLRAELDSTAQQLNSAVHERDSAVYERDSAVQRALAVEQEKNEERKHRLAAEKARQMLLEKLRKAGINPDQL